MKKFLGTVGSLLLMLTWVSPASSNQPPLSRAWFLDGQAHGGAFGTPILRDMRLFASTATHAVAVDVNGNLIWSKALPVTSSASLAFRGELVFVPLQTGVSSLNVQSGEEVWTREGDEVVSLQVVPDGLIVLDQTSVSLISSETGGVEWELELQVTPLSNLAFVGEGFAFISDPIGDEASTLIVLNVSDGGEIWTKEVAEGTTSPAVLGKGYVLGAGDFLVRLLDASSGEEIWSSEVEGKFGAFSQPAVAFGDVFIADRIGNIYRLDGETGERKWIFSDTEGTFEQSSPVVAGDTVYIGSSAGNLYGVDAHSGELVWEDQVDGFVLSGAADEERFYFGVKFGEQGLYAYEHDPTGGSSRDRAEWVVGAIAILGVLLAVVVIIVRRRSKPAAQL